MISPTTVELATRMITQILDGTTADSGERAVVLSSVLCGQRFESPDEFSRWLRELSTHATDLYIDADADYRGTDL